MRRSSICTMAVLAALAVVPTAASAGHLGTGYPDCLSPVLPASAGSYNLGEVKSRGFGGGFIGSVALPFISGVTPPPSATEADVVGALLSLDFFGVLGGGTTQVRPVAGVVGASGTHSGAQILTSSLFTGHFKAEPRTYVCESVVRANTIVTWSYFELTLSGLLTPTTGGSPLKEWAQALRIGVLPGNNNPS